MKFNGENVVPHWALCGMLFVGTTVASVIMIAGSRSSTVKQDNLACESVGFSASEKVTISLKCENDWTYHYYDPKFIVDFTQHQDGKIICKLYQDNSIGDCKVK